MIKIDPKSFYMGSELSEDELPIRKAILTPYLIDKEPVTNKEYMQFIKVGGLVKGNFGL